ncbi:MAG: SIMPL domain-containing protein [Acidimicrobiales bacterium]
MSAKVISRAGYAAMGAAVVACTALGLGVAEIAGASTASAADPGSVTPVAACGTGPTVTATGSGTAYGNPDLLTMQIGVRTTASSAGAALARNNTQAQALVATLKNGGVKAADIQTSNLSINPTYSNNNGNNPKVTGYQVEDDLTVQIHQLSSAGALIDAAAAKLGNDVSFNGLSFSVSDPSGPSAAARASAVHVAVVEARAMASAAGSSLGPLCAITDNGSSQPSPFLQSGSLAFAKSAGAGAATVPIQAGSEQFTAQVSATYRLG